MAIFTLRIESTLVRAAIERAIRMRLLSCSPSHNRAIRGMNRGAVIFSNMPSASCRCARA